MGLPLIARLRKGLPSDGKSCMSITQIENTGTRSKSKEIEILKGFMACVLLGLLSFFSISLARDNFLLNFATQIVIPLLATYALTRNWLTTFTLMTIVDTFLSFTSLYFISIGLPTLLARGILFVITMVILLTSLYSQQHLQKPDDSYWNFSATSVLILLYGLFLPIMLVLYSVFFGDTSPEAAFGDMKFIFPVLLYYPISRLLKRHSEIFLGWVLAISVIHVIISLTISMGPIDITSIVWQNYGNVLDETALDKAIIENYDGLARIQNASPAFITSLFGFFTGFLIATDSTKKMYLQFLGFGFGLFCLSHLFFDYMRGPLIATVIVLLMFGFVSTLKRQFHSYAFRTFMFVIAVILIGGYVMYLVVPQGFARFAFTGTLQSYLGEARAEQSDRMIEAFKEEPILGQGIGSKIRGGYERAEGGLNFELQYQMILYRVGIVGFVILMAPLIWLIAELFRKKGAMSNRLFQIEGKFHMCLLLSILATCVAGYANPYLKTGYIALTFAMYLAYRIALRDKRCQLSDRNCMGEPFHK